MHIVAIVLMKIVFLVNCIVWLFWVLYILRRWLFKSYIYNRYSNILCCIIPTLGLVLNHLADSYTFFALIYKKFKKIGKFAFIIYKYILSINESKVMIELYYRYQLFVILHLPVYITMASRIPLLIKHIREIRRTRRILSNAMMDKPLAVYESIPYTIHFFIMFLYYWYCWGLGDLHLKMKQWGFASGNTQISDLLAAIKLAHCSPEFLNTLTWPRTFRFCQKIGLVDILIYWIDNEPACDGLWWYDFKTFCSRIWDFIMYILNKIFF